MSRVRSLSVVVAALCGVAVLGGLVASRDARNNGGDARHGHDSSPESVRLGYLPNLTNAIAIVGIDEGTYRRALRPTKLETQVFNAGPDAALALMSGAIDAAYLGPSPVINAFIHSNGEAIRVVSGAASGGAALVVREGIDTPEQLRGRTVATPQLGGTQDVALRWWLEKNGLETSPEGGGDVEILPQKNGQTIAAFRQGILDGAWLPEPWASRLVAEGGAHVLVDERELWPEGQDVTNVLAVRTELLEQHPDIVRRLLEGQAEAADYIGVHPQQAQQLVNRSIDRITGQTLPPEVVDAAWARIDFGPDLSPDAFVESARRAKSVGLLPSVDLDGLVDLRLLDQVRAAQRRATVNR